MTSLARAMSDADRVVIDGVVFEMEYLRVPDEYTVAEDVVLEGRRGEDAVAFTLDEVEDARFLGDGMYRLASGTLLRFLSTPTLH